jgi:preprotein translocase subunit SecY
MTRLTFAGAVFLTLIAILPQMLSEGMNVPYMTSQFFGGTGLLIIVGVTLDTMRQVETHLLQRHYDGFLRRGKLRGRFERTAGGAGNVISSSTMVWIYAALGLLIMAGTAIYLASGN